MIGFLRGKVHLFGNDYVLLDVNNVGYRINFYHPEKLKIGEEVLIYTYENIREDEQSLFGFLSYAEYELFVKLISVIVSYIIRRRTKRQSVPRKF